jgi:hypothetical protein
MAIETWLVKTEIICLLYGITKLFLKYNTYEYNAYYNSIYIFQVLISVEHPSLGIWRHKVNNTFKRKTVLVRLFCGLYWRRKYYINIS